MKRIFVASLALLLGILITTNMDAQHNNQTKAALPPENFKSEMAHVNGINIHYVIGGSGIPLVLIHGFGENWYFWNRLLPELSKHFTVIAPDLRGVGESDKPDQGYDKKTMATDINLLVKKLGYDKIYLVGHDIGLMVAYAYAAQYRAEVKKLVLMDALLPGVEPAWSQYEAKAWWWGFFSWSAAGSLVEGKERFFLTNFWAEQWYMKNSFTKEEVEEFIRAYSVPGSTTGSFHWFGTFQQDVKDNTDFAKEKLAMPVLAVGGDHHTGSFLAQHIKVVADNVTEAKIKDAGHWLVQEQTEQVQKALLNFFLTN